jgi:hypothetical protein
MVGMTMRTRRFFIGVMICLAIAVPLLAQEGFPLKGTWRGDFGANAKDRTEVTVVMDWDGKEISGIINPGASSVPLLKPTLNPADWSVHFEADAKDASGKSVHYVVDGKIDNLGWYYRKIIGTWMAGSAKNDFTLTRQ